jgi:Tn7-like transposition protein D
VDERVARVQGQGVKFIRGKFPKLYGWLYRHDTAWLKAHLPAKRKARRQVPLVDWQQRDQELAQLVEISAHRLRHQAGKPTRITLAAIGRDIGQLALLQQHLPKLLVTGRLLKDFIETRETFAIRRIQWIAKQYECEQLRPRKWEFIKKAGVERMVMVPQVKEVLEATLQRLPPN